ncbi:MAG TPA: threonine synthase, partial [candidate division CPR3 bacterium]|nr:threonine synthase [candidate division CPR3 bacterium]
MILRCIECGREYPINEVRYRCDCGDLLEVVHDIEKLKKRVSCRLFDERLAKREFPYNSGVWRYKELVSDIDSKFIISRPEGNTNLYRASKVEEYVGIEDIWLKLSLIHI